MGWAAMTLASVQKNSFSAQLRGRRKRGIFHRAISEGQGSCQRKLQKCVCVWGGRVGVGIGLMHVCVCVCVCEGEGRCGDRAHVFGGSIN